MKRHVLSFSRILIFVLVGILGGVYSKEAFALTYQQDIGVNFTFNSTLSIALSAQDLLIENLAPGTASDSNVITVRVITNATQGYTLNATVGNSQTFDTDDLVHSNSNYNNVFSNTTFSATPTLSSNTNLDPDTWAFSYSTNNGSTWANYNGLPLYSDTEHIATLKSSNNPIASTSGDEVKFKIAAKASSTQVSGEYNNVINFNLVAAPVPTTLAMAYEAAHKTQLYGYYQMQDMTSAICNAVEVDNDELQVIDSRDNKVYWIAKLEDGHCWMTQNLDLDLDSTRTYTHADTDLGWGSDSATVSWQPSSETKGLNADGKTFTSMGTGTVDRNSPRSRDLGDWYYAGNDGTSPLPFTAVNYLTSENRTTVNGVTTVNDGAGHDFFSTAPFDTNGAHGHLGNYYNWTAAVAMNDTSSRTTSTLADVTNNPQNSICPAGWRLPTASSVAANDEYSRLAVLYAGYKTGSFVATDASKLEAAPLYMIRNGMISGSTFNNPGKLLSYWTSTVSSASHAYTLYGNGDDFYGYGQNYRYLGRPIRCLAR